MVLVALPLLWPVAGIGTGDRGALLEGVGVFADAQPWILLARSAGLSMAITLMALGIGVPLGLLLGRTDVLGARTLLPVHVFPLFLPPFLLALGWFHLLGRQGLIGNAATSAFLFNEGGMVGVLSLAFSPVITALVALGLWNLDPSLEEAARVVARPGRVLVRILLPAVVPSIALGAIIVFALAFSELGVPLFLRVAVYPAAIFARLGGIDYDPIEAFLRALPLLPIAFLLLLGERWIFRSCSFAVLGLRHQGRQPMPLGRARPFVSGICWLVVAASLSPLAALTIQALQGGGFAELHRWIGSTLINSVLGAVAAATLITAIAIVLGHASARRVRGAAIFDFLAVLAFVVPAVLLGIGFMALWNRPATWFLYSTLGIVILGYTARYAIIGIRTVAVVVAQSPQSLEQAGAAFGGGYFQRLRLIVMGVHRRGLAAAWLLALVFCLRDLEMAVIYYPPGWEPLTVRIFTLEANGPVSVVAAMSLLQIGVTATALGVGGLLLWRRRRT